MGDYLVIDSRETNSKIISGILIDIIRYLDSSIKNDTSLSNETGNMFKADYYDENNVGSGDYIITTKGMALLAKTLLDISRNSERIIEYTCKYYRSNISELYSRSEIVKTDHYKCMYEVVQYCYKYISEILLDMIITERSKVLAHWV